MITRNEQSGVAWLTIDTGKRLNGMGMVDLVELQTLLEQEAGRAGTRCLVLAGKEDFVGGLVPGELAALDEAGGNAWSELGQGICAQIEDAPFPSIAAVDGLAIGGGLEIALSCDFIIAGQNAKFIQVEALAGLIPGFGGTWRLPQHIGLQRARLMTYTGMTVGANQAAEWGLALRTVASAELRDGVEQLAASLSRASAEAAAGAKRTFQSTFGKDRETANAEEKNMFSKLFSSSEMHTRMAALSVSPPVF